MSSGQTSDRIPDRDLRYDDIHPSPQPLPRSQEMEQLRSIARLMDDMFEIPGVRWRIGLDGIIGLIPGVGDFVGFIVSSYFILIASRLNVSRFVIARMFVNILIEAAFGAIPFLGDIFDFAWKANRKNLVLLERSMTEPSKEKRRSLAFLALLTATLLSLGIFLAWVLVQITQWAFHLIGSLF